MAGPDGWRSVEIDDLGILTELYNWKLSNKGVVLMKKVFLLLYTMVVFSIVILFVLCGKVRNPMFYLSILIFVIIGKIIALHIDKEK